MGVNASPVVGRVRITAPASKTLERLLVDGENAHNLAYKLEEELLDDEEEVKVEDVKAESGSGSGRKYPGLREKGTTIVQGRIDRLLEDQGLVGDDLADELRLKRVSSTWFAHLNRLTCDPRPRPLPINGSHTCVLAYPHATTASRHAHSQKSCIANVSLTNDLVQRPLRRPFPRQTRQKRPTRWRRSSGMRMAKMRIDEMTSSAKRSLKRGRSRGRPPISRMRDGKSH